MKLDVDLHVYYASVTIPVRWFGRILCTCIFKSRRLSPPLAWWAEYASTDGEPDGFLYGDRQLNDIRSRNGNRVAGEGSR